MVLIEQGWRWISFETRRWTERCHYLIEQELLQAILPNTIKQTSYIVWSELEIHALEGRDGAFLLNSSPGTQMERLTKGRWTDWFSVE